MTWEELIHISKNDPLLLERVRIQGQELVIEGRFELPPLAKFSLEDQVFIAAFVKTHGSIKQMEKIFGISYPTVKNRLNRLAEKLDFIKTDTEPDRIAVLSQLDQGLISVEQALERLT